MLIIDEGGDAGELTKYAGELRREGLAVRVDRAAPEGLGYGRLVRFTKEGPVNG